MSKTGRTAIKSFWKTAKQTEGEKTLFGNTVLGLQVYHKNEDRNLKNVSKYKTKVSIKKYFYSD